MKSITLKISVIVDILLLSGYSLCLSKYEADRTVDKCNPCLTVSGKKVGENDPCEMVHVTLSQKDKEAAGIKMEDTDVFKVAKENGLGILSIHTVFGTPNSPPLPASVKALKAKLIKEASANDKDNEHPYLKGVAVQAIMDSEKSGEEEEAEPAEGGDEGKDEENTKDAPVAAK